MGAIVLFDGVCNFCNGTVNFIIARDRGGYFKFAPLQSEIGERLRAQYEIDESIDSIVLIEDEIAYTYSDAALRIARSIGGALGNPLCFHNRAKTDPRFFLSTVCEEPVPIIREKGCLHGADTGNSGTIFVNDYVAAD